MVDIVDRKARSRMMSGIRGRDTKPEKVVRSELFKRGFRYRLNVKSLPGRPDIVLRRWSTAIQVNGCFWHGHVNCRHFKIPATRRAFWLAKIHANQARDKRTTGELLALGWKCVEVWECSLRRNPEGVVDRVAVAIAGKKKYVVI